MSKRTRSAELAALTSIAAQVNCTQDLDEILRGALKTTLEVVGVDAGEVFLIDESSGELMLHAHQGLSEAFLSAEAQIGPGDCLCGVAAGAEQIIAVLDIESHPARSRPACLREGFRSLLCLPLRARGQVLGLLNVQSREVRHFTPADQELLRAIGNQIGIAIANARLIDDAEQRRATLDSVMNSLVDGLMLIDPAGRIAFANPCAEEMLQAGAGGLVGRSVEAIDGELARLLGQPQAVIVPLWSAAQAGEPPLAELELLAPRRRTLQVRGFAIRSPGGERLALGLLLRDITRERELDRMKSQLLATVSHELRTPLASIKGFATTLLREDVQWDDDSRREFLSIIDEESDRLGELIGNLLDMSRIEAGTLRLEPEPVDLAPMIQETVAAFRVITRAHQFTVDLPPELPMVWADPRRVRQVLRNLVENAVKYSPQGGPVTVSARQGSGAVQVSVSDRGLGIAPEHLEHIFDRFYQVDGAATRQVGGAGLGLSISKAFVEAQQGRMWVESEPAAGSTFHFTLPVYAPAQAP